VQTSTKILLAVGVTLLAGGIIGYAYAATNSSALSSRFFVECTPAPTLPTCFQLLSDLAYWGLISALAAAVAALGILFVIIGAILEVVRSQPPPAPVAYAPPPMMYGPAGRTCARCGSIVPPGWGFCGRCGTRV